MTTTNLRRYFGFSALCLLVVLLPTRALVTPRQVSTARTTFVLAAKSPPPSGKLSSQRRKQLGIADDEDEYDLSMALQSNTDSLISKILAGSFILVVIALLVVGVVVPSLTDYSNEGLCNPLQTAGRC